MDLIHGIEFSTIIALLNKGTSLEKVKKYFYLETTQLAPNFIRIKVAKKYNAMLNGKLISPQWLDYIGQFYGNYSYVKLNGKLNILSKEGKIISKQWFDYIGGVVNGFAIVVLNNRYNALNINGKLLSEVWFDNITPFFGDESVVTLNNKQNILTKEGKLLSEQWFDSVIGSKSLYRVKLHEKYNFLINKGKLLSEQWFDAATLFYGKTAQIRINKQWYALYTDGSMKLIQI